MSGSDHDFSESSNVESPHSQDSPYSSPSQQVPHLASAFSGITCDDVTMHVDGNRVRLRIVEQPQYYFRFRYKSEMVGTHGCLLGRSTHGNKGRTHPTVELLNYTGKALIRVRLAQADGDEEHPHKLLEDEQEDRDVSTVVPQQGSYKVGFAGMGIIHTAKKDVVGLLFKKYMETPGSNLVPPKELKAVCENKAKSINLNIVRLRFSAHDLATDRELCPPVYSEPIHNMKSAATNDLKICRVSRYQGKARGGDDVFIFVEKVNKKNIKIRFYELDDNGEEVWSAFGNFLQSDVHHQYAIVFRTPPYGDPNTTKDVKVYMELVRPSDGRSSEPKEFVYKAEHVFNKNKRRRTHSSYSSIGSSSGGSIQSMNEVPATVDLIEQTDRDGISNNQPYYQITIPQIPVAQPTSELSLGDALYYDTGVEMPSVIQPVGPMLGAPNVPEPPVLSLNSAELDRLIKNELPEDEKKKFCETDFTEYFKVMRSLGDSLTEKSLNSVDFITAMDLVSDSGRGKSVNSMDFLKAMDFVSDSGRGKSVNSMDFLKAMDFVSDSGRGKSVNSMDFPKAMDFVSDSGRGKGEIKKEPVSPVKPSEEKKQKIADKSKSNEGYTACYTLDDGTEVKKLVKEICEVIKTKRVANKQIIRSKLERLFEMRLSNGDTFIHMALLTNQPSLEYIIKLIHSMRMQHLLNLTNNLQQSILHLAVINELHKVIPFLVSKGCDPMVGDAEGNNALHYAVVCGGAALTPLLDAVRQNGVACDLNAYNNERQTPLHLAAVYNSDVSARLLLQYGASYTTRDGCGRTALHLAATDGSLRAAATMLRHIPSSEIDMADGVGNTALQIVCAKDNVCEETLEVVKILLEKKADPLKHEESNISAWRLAQDKPQLKQLLLQQCPELASDDDVKSEPDDDFESADEGEIETGLSELPLYIHNLSGILDGRGAWRELARRLHADSLLSWYANTRSPAHTLLQHLKDSGDSLSSKSLMLILQDMGEMEAADVIRQVIE